MLRKLTSTLTFPAWAPEGSRWRWLDIYDKILDGQIYNHLPYSFYDEQDGAGNYVPLSQRRPSCQFHLAGYVARWAARKLFAGRHVPKVRAKSAAGTRDKVAEQAISDMLTGTKIWPTMFEAAYRGSVGSVAISFRVAEGKVGLKVWRALHCSPFFDDFGELAMLRVHYCTSGDELAKIGISVQQINRRYWFIRDYGPEEEITYVPVLQEDWNPVTGFAHPADVLQPGVVVKHGLGFVPAIWIKNPCGHQDPDGAALWGNAVPNVIEVDYLLSQAARGSRYSCAPQLVTVGVVKNIPPEGTSNPTTLLAFDAAHKDQESGEMLGQGDAKLLEMNGSGAEAALKIVDVLKKLALEQVGVVQKDPGEMPGPLSGRAMEYLDEDAHDTAMQWRTTYGEGGALPLICKIARVLKPGVDVTRLWLQWPRIYQPTPADLQTIVQALVMATAAQPVSGVKPAEDGSIPTLAPLMDPETARAYLEANMDLGILDDTEGNAPAGTEGGEPRPTDEEPAVGGQFGPYWRILPPISVR